MTARRSHLVLLGVVVVWAGSFSAIKALLDDGVGALDIAIARYAIAAPGFAVILWHRGGLPGLTRRDAGRVAAAGLCVVLGYHLALNVGTRYTTAGVAALVVALAPGMTLVLAWLLGLDRMRPRQVVGLAVAFAGVAVVVALGAGETLSFQSAKGPLIVVGAPLFWMLRRGAPLTPGLTAFLAALAALSLANVEACLTRPHEFAATVLVWHGGTVVAFAALCALTGTRWLRWPEMTTR